jgi:hypothetical protein
VDKKNILTEARHGADYPIAAVLKQGGTDVQVYWAP